MLLEDFHLRSSFLEQGGVSELVSLLTSEYAVIQELALNSLVSCMHHGKLVWCISHIDQVQYFNICYLVKHNFFVIAKHGCRKQF